MSERDPLAAPPPFLITVRCPDCGDDKRVRREDVDPPDARTIAARCRDCTVRFSGPYVVKYFDAHGREVPL